MRSSLFVALAAQTESNLAAVPGLTDEQRQCLEDAVVTRPWGPLTKEQRQQVRSELKAAAQKCDIALPAKPTNMSAMPACTT